MHKMRPWHKMTKLFRNQDGVSLLEFGLILPVLMIILIGGLEITRLILFHQKIDNATSRVADLITQMDMENVPCSGVGSLQWMRDHMMTAAMSPYSWDEDGQLIVSAVEAEYSDPNNPDNSIPTEQRVKWQWTSAGGNASHIGNEGGLANGSAWPGIFRVSPNAGGMFDGDRIIAVEVFYVYSPLIPGMEFLIPSGEHMDMYKNAFFRARFGNLNNLGDGC